MEQRSLGARTHALSSTSGNATMRVRKKATAKARKASLSVGLRQGDEGQGQGAGETARGGHEGVRQLDRGARGSV